MIMGMVAGKGAQFVIDEYAQISLKSDVKTHILV